LHADLEHAHRFAQGLEEIERSPGGVDVEGDD
jgi:hypothetical protein